MKVTIAGTGYVGLVTGACLAEVGNDVVCLDLDEKKIRMLNSGEVPIFEPGLAAMVKKCEAAGHLRFTNQGSQSPSCCQSSTTVDQSPRPQESRSSLEKQVGTALAADATPTNVWSA